MVRNFRDRIFPGATAATPTAAGATSFSTTAAGVGANARISLANKRVVIGGHFLGGDGMGRYGASNLADITVNPDGTLALLKSAQGLGTVEFHTARLDLYFNAGAEFVGRHFEFNGKGTNGGIRFANCEQHRLLPGGSSGLSWLNPWILGTCEWLPA